MAKKKTNTIQNETPREPGILSFQFWYNAISSILFVPNEQNFFIVQILIIALEILISYLIIENIPYTEIDWSTYMQQVECYLKKDIRNYSEIGGDTGPIVYPGGHLSFFAELYDHTDEGKNIRKAQYIFGCLFILNLATNFQILMRFKNIPPFVMLLMSVTGYRIHSIFMLRLFNDPFAMLIFYISINLILSRFHTIGCVIFSAAVSIKMNVLLFAPALFFTLLMNTGITMTVVNIVICGVIQIMAGYEFLIHDWKSYLIRSFDLSRVFMYEWTVNWRCLPENIFLDKRLHLTLLVAHITVLAIFAYYMWFRSQGGLKCIVQRALKNIKTESDELETYFAFCTSNLIGIAFSRSLHYQFYSWYYHQLPFLLFSNYPNISRVQDIPWLSIVLKVAVLFGIEVCWNVFPSTWWSSALLHVLHFVIILHLIQTRRPVVAPKVIKLKRKEIFKQKRR